MAFSGSKSGQKRWVQKIKLKLNQITKPNSDPLSLIDNILALLGKAKFFTSLDLKSGYWQVWLDEADKEKTAFACHRWLFEFIVMPFGISCAPSPFSRSLWRSLYKAFRLQMPILMIF